MRAGKTLFTQLVCGSYVYWHIISEEAKLEAFFLQEAKQALALKSEISKTDAEIDRMVYELYGSTEEEIKIVESQ